MDDIAVIVVPLEIRAVAVATVADIPFHEFVNRGFYRSAIAFAREFPEGGFQHRAEKQPVVIARFKLPAGLPLRNDPGAVLLGKPAPQVIRSTQEGEADVSRFHQGLVAMVAAEVLEICCGRIENMVRGANRECEHGRPFFTLWRCIWPEFQPWSNTGKCSGIGFKIGERDAFPLPIPHRQGCNKFVLRQSSQHRPRQSLQRGESVSAVIPPTRIALVFEEIWNFHFLVGFIGFLLLFMVLLNNLFLCKCSV